MACRPEDSTQPSIVLFPNSGSGRQQHLPAGGRQVGHLERRPRRRRRIRRRRRLRMQHRVGEPVVEILAADLSRRHRILRLAVGAVGRTPDADVEMIVVPVPGPHLVQPAAVVAGLAAERLLDRRVDEDALDDRVLGGRLDDLGMRRRPDASDRRPCGPRPTTMVADISSRSRRVSSRSGIGVSQMSASRPT